MRRCLTIKQVFSVMLCWALLLSAALTPPARATGATSEIPGAYDLPEQLYRWYLKHAVGQYTAAAAKAAVETAEAAAGTGSAVATEAEISAATESILAAGGLRLVGLAGFTVQQVAYAVATGYACANGFANAEEWYESLNPAKSGEPVSAANQIFYDAGNFVLRSSVVGQAKALIAYAKDALMGKTTPETGQDGKNAVSAENPVFVMTGPSAAYSGYEGQNFSVGSYFNPAVMMSAVDIARLYNSMPAVQAYEHNSVAHSSWVTSAGHSMQLLVVKYNVGATLATAGPFCIFIRLFDSTTGKIVWHMDRTRVTATVSASSFNDLYLYGTYDGMYISYGWNKGTENISGPFAAEYFTQSQTQEGEESLAYTAEYFLPTDAFLDDLAMTLSDYFQRFDAEINGVQATLQGLIDSAGNQTLYVPASDAEQPDIEITLNDLLSQISGTRVAILDTLAESLGKKPFMVGDQTYSLPELETLLRQRENPVTIVAPDGITTTQIPAADLLDILAAPEVPDDVIIEIDTSTPETKTVPDISISIKQGETTIRETDGGEVPETTPTAAPTAAPTVEPTTAPTAEPTADPTAAPTADPDPTAGPTADPTPQVSPTPIETPDIDGLGLPDLGAALTSRFPFSIPWDFMALVELLEAPPQAPRFETDFFAPLSGRVGGWQGETKLILDFSEFDTVSRVSRTVFLIGYCFLLVSATKRLVWVTGG